MGEGEEDPHNSNASDASNALPVEMGMDGWLVVARIPSIECWLRCIYLKVLLLLLLGASRVLEKNRSGGIEPNRLLSSGFLLL